MILKEIDVNTDTLLIENTHDIAYKFISLGYVDIAWNEHCGLVRESVQW